LWVVHFGETISGPNRAAVAEFSTRSTGDVAPVNTIAGAKTDLQFPVGVSVDASGDLIVSDLIYGPSGASAVLTFARTVRVH
jgi:hypothetical protein